MSQKEFKLLAEKYIKNINKTYFSGIATEHSYRPYLQDFLEAYCPKITLINDPKRRECGAPDFVVTKGKSPAAPAFAFIETKDLGSSITRALNTKQIERYKDSLNSLILTNYTTFIWIYRGREIAQCSIAKFDPKTGAHATFPEELKELEKFFKEFSEGRSETVIGTKELASRMAGIAKLLKRAIDHELKHEANGDLRNQLESFREYILHDLDEDSFADMYAQTMCYGLLAARYHHDIEETFSRRTALLPRTNPFLRWLFSHISSAKLDPSISWLIDDLANLLRDCDVISMLNEMGRSSWKQDPVLHFYESFLSEYNQKLRVEKGVYYTPDPIVKYIVNSVDSILKTKFKIERGLADFTKYSKKKNKNHEDFYQVNILDPACGTGTFLVEVIKKIHASFKGNEGLWKTYISESLLPRLFGFEILMAPYTIAHLKIAHALGLLDISSKNHQRINVILTNTLERPYEFADLPLFKFAKEVAEEVNSASEVKLTTPVMVILGNPPYQASSENKCGWINELLKGKDLISRQPTDNYFQVNGEPLGERNSKWLNDDYVKFIRFGQWRINKTESGILAFVTNHMYLNNQTFRGMRESLLDSFNEIYIINLHGNSKLNEKCPDGSKDENVFDIRQGVCISFFIKNPRKRKSEVFYCDLHGCRENGSIWLQDKIIKNIGKYEWLNSNDITSTPWLKINPKAPYYRFDIFNDSLIGEYKNFTSLENLFPIQSLGIATARDSLTIQFTKDEILKVAKEFKNSDPSAAKYNFSLREDARDWKIHLAQKDLNSIKKLQDKLSLYSYRPFDFRYTIYTGKTKGFHCMPRFAVMEHIINNDNLSLIFTRQVKGETYQHVFVSKFITDSTFLTGKTGSPSRVAPILLYKNGKPELNVSNEFLSSFERIVGQPISPTLNLSKNNNLNALDLLGYIYGILWTPSFKTRYQSLLVNDYPCIPLVNNKQTLLKLILLGKELIRAHTNIDFNNNDEISFPFEGSNFVEYINCEECSENKMKIHINKFQFFEFKNIAIPKFYVGGYRICEKWLKDRKGRRLSHEDLLHFIGIAKSISDSIKIIHELELLWSNTEWYKNKM